MTLGIFLCAAMVLGVAVLPILAIASAYRADEAQFPARDARGDVR